MKKLALLCLLIPITAYCQVERGTIVGTVTDSGGGVLTGADVTVRNTDTNVLFQTKTNEAGAYVAPDLLIGNYEVVIKVEGFKQNTVSGIKVGVGQRVRADAALQIGDIKESINVAAQAELVQDEASSVGTAITRQSIVDLPLNGRSFIDLLALSSGITTGTPGRLLNGRGVQTARGSSSFSNNGMRDTSNNFLIDGIDNNDMAVGTITYYPSVDAIAEFKVQTSASDAEFGRNGGGAVNLITKSGTNELHGSAFEFLRNTDMNAKNFFVAHTSPTPTMNRNQFGFSLGGPVKKNKLFFFGDYEGRRYIDGLTYVNTVPTLAQRAGNYTGLATLYDPSTYNATAQTRQPFPGNQIPASSISPISQFLYAFYPAPTQSGINNFVYSPNQTTRGDQFDVKGDYYLSDKDNMFLRSSYSYFNLLKPDEYPATSLGSGNGGTSNYGGSNVDPTHQVSYMYTHLFSPTLVNTVRLGYTRFVIDQTPSNFDKNLTAEAGIPGINVSSQSSGLMQSGITGYGTLGDSQFSPALLFQNSFNVQESITWNHGAHSVKAGLQIVRRQLNFFQAQVPRGLMSFDTSFTSSPAAPSTTGDGFADFLLALPTSGSLTRLSGPYGERYSEWAGFAKDDWKLLPNLTLNLGLRYELDTPFTEVHNRMANLDYNTGQIIVAGTAGWPRGLVEADTNNVAPRVGLAWSPGKSRKTVIRSAFGVFYNIEAPVTSTRLTENAPFMQTPGFANNLFQPTYTMGMGFPTVNVNLANPSGIGVNTWQRDFQDGRVMQWNTAIEREVARDLVIRGMYVGSRSLHLFARGDANEAVPGAAPLASRRPFPNLLAFNAIQSRGNATYESAQFQVEKRMSHGVSFLSAFTWGKAIDDAPGGLNDYDSGGSTQPDNFRNMRAEKALSDFDIGRRWVTSTSWELPFGHKQALGAHWNPAVNAFLGGWQVNGILSFQDGLPISIAGPNETNGSDCFCRPDRLGNGNLPTAKRTLSDWYDKTAFAAPALYTFGNAGRNIISTPGLRNMDFSILKNFQVGERFTFQYRAEAFDIMNTPFFGPPNKSYYLAAGGVISTAYTERILQMGLKLLF